MNEGSAAHAATIVARGHHHGGVSPDLGHAHRHLHCGLSSYRRKKEVFPTRHGERGQEGEDQTRTEASKGCRRERAGPRLNPAPGQGASPPHPATARPRHSGLTLAAGAGQQELVLGQGLACTAHHLQALTAGQEGELAIGALDHEACKRSDTLPSACEKPDIGLNSPRFLPPQHHCFSYVSFQSLS